ncbi:MAG TPA: Asp-tRNA(Asn)/Glu-tRNA(Gln) amidotransferase subunit GatB [Burkholderiales bacterium]|nr:Asp-tRNA(Asn)/Glu-tRNA(Gln) amidotransferase subunit GatB [Burkholderiales bacterium]
MNWEVVVGIETHAQLLTQSKMFSGASTAFGASPNTQASAVDIALPGTLPVVNRAAIEHAIRFGHAVHGKINDRSIFARKNYFYPDLPKGYQISQYETPIVEGGEIRLFMVDQEKVVRLTRAHLEEDAGKSLHEDFHGMTGIDLNRAGTPLLEIVSEPDLRGAKEAVAYARTLHSLVKWINICDGNMQEGSFRCDANVSVRRVGDGKLGTRCEIKNLNSFRFMERAIEFEARRQIELLEDGGKVIQETRLYDPERDETRSMRTKEDAQDYRYFPDPDLLPLVVSEALMARAWDELAKTGTPETRRVAYERGYGSELTAQDRVGLTQSRDTADYFDTLIEELKKAGHALGAKIAANFILGEMAAQLNDSAITISEAPIKPAALAGLIGHVLRGEISISTAKKVFPQLWKHSFKTVGELLAELKDAPPAPGVPVLTQLFYNVDPNTLAGTLGHTSTASVSIANLWQMADTSEIERIVEDVLKNNARQVQDYRAGKEKAFNSLVGQVMKATRGKANPAQVNELLKRKLS